MQYSNANFATMDFVRRRQQELHCVFVDTEKAYDVKTAVLHDQARSGREVCDGGAGHV